VEVKPHLKLKINFLGDKMANGSGLNTTVTTPRARVSYPKIFTPELNKLSNKKEYSVQALFEHPISHECFKSIKLVVANAIQNKWGADKAKWPKIRLPWKTQDEMIARAKEKNQNHEHLIPGALTLTFKTSAVDKNGAARPRPDVVGKDPKIHLTEPHQFYAGCWGKFSVTAAAYSQAGNNGVSLYLNSCQFVGDAPQFGNKVSAEHAFEAIPDDDISETSAAESSEGLDDLI